MAVSPFENLNSNERQVATSLTERMFYLEGIEERPDHLVKPLRPDQIEYLDTGRQLGEQLIGTDLTDEQKVDVSGGVNFANQLATDFHAADVEYSRHSRRASSSRILSRGVFFGSILGSPIGFAMVDSMTVKTGFVGVAAAGIWSALVLNAGMKVENRRADEQQAEKQRIRRMARQVVSSAVRR